MEQNELPELKDRWCDRPKKLKMFMLSDVFEAEPFAGCGRSPPVDGLGLLSNKWTFSKAVRR